MYKIIENFDSNIFNDIPDITNSSLSLNSLGLDGILPVVRGGTGASSLNPKQFDNTNNTLSIKSNSISPWNEDNMNIYYNLGNVGIGKGLDVSGNITASNFFGSGSNLSALNASNITLGTVPPGRGGTGATSLNPSQFDVTNNILSIKGKSISPWNEEQMNLYYNLGDVSIGKKLDVSGNITASKFIGSGTELSGLNASNITLGTLPVGRGGTGATSLNLSQFDVTNNILSIKGNSISPWNAENMSLYYNLGNVGIGKNNPSTTLDVSGNITAVNFFGSGSNLSALNASNIISGTLPINRGGTGATTLAANQVLIGGNTLMQSANLTWNNTSNTLSASNFSGSGTGLSGLNASNITLGTLPVGRGGTGATSLNSSQFDVSNNILSIKGNSISPWNVENMSLYYNLGNVGIGKNNPSTTLDVSGNITGVNFIGSGSNLSALNASNITLGTLPINRGGTGATTLAANQILIGGVNAMSQSANLTWNNTSNTLSASNFSGSGTGLSAINASNITSGILTVNGSGLSAINASNISSGTLSISRGGTGTTNLAANQVLIGGETLMQSANLTWNNNKLGIGKTNPNQSLDVSGNIYISGTNPALLINSGNSLLGVASSTGSYSFGAKPGDLILRSDPNTNLILQSGTVSTINDKPGIYINNSNYVGIGKTNPTSSLDVKGDFCIDSNCLNSSNIKSLNDIITKLKTNLIAPLISGMRGPNNAVIGNPPTTADTILGDLSTNTINFRLGIKSILLSDNTIYNSLILPVKSSKPEIRVYFSQLYQNPFGTVLVLERSNNGTTWTEVSNKNMLLPDTQLKFLTTETG